MKKKYVIYARSASEYGKGEFNIDYQITELIKFAQESGLEIVGVISEYGSGMDSDRPGLLRLMYQIKTNKVQGILCTSVDRLARDNTLFLKLKRMFKDSDIEVILPNALVNPFLVEETSCTLDKCIMCGRIF